MNHTPFEFQVEVTECNNCLVWAKNDDLVREVIKLSSNLTVRTSHFFLFFRFQVSLVAMESFNKIFRDVFSYSCRRQSFEMVYSLIF